MSLQNNPFYILGIACNANRRSIMAAADDMSFTLDSETCTDAQNALINPVKRLAAELDWFIDIDEDQIRIIRTHIEKSEILSTDGLSPLSKLNAAEYNFTLSSESDIYEIGYSIIEIDELLAEINSNDLLEQINTCRLAAKLPEVQSQTLLQELNKKRGSLRQIITEKLSSLDESNYIELITLLAEKLVNNEENTGGAVISDVVDQYEIRMQALLEDKTENIRNHIEDIKHLSDDGVVTDSIRTLIREVQDWDKFAQPLQLKSQGSGMPHEISESLGYQLRNLALYLHNEKGKTNEALLLVDAMQGVFAELGNLSEQFESDSNALNKLLQGEKDMQEVAEELDSISKESERLKNYASNSSVDSFIDRVKQIDNKLKVLDLDAETKSKIRESLCFLARGTAIEIHNNKHQTQYALNISKALVAEFSDLPSLRVKLTEDVVTLQKQLLLSPGLSSSDSNSSLRSSYLGRLLVVVIVIAFFLIVTGINSGVGSSSHSSSSSSTYSTSSSSSSSSGSATPSVSNSGNSSGNTSTSGSSSGKSSGTTSEGTSGKSSGTTSGSTAGSTESKFSSSSLSGSKVYVDIVSIFPEIGIYTEGSSTYSYFVCKCKTSSGSTVWVYTTVSEYKNNFDSTVSASIYNDYADEVTFSTSKRIHGTVKSANDIMYGLSSDTGSYVIDFSSLG